MTETAQGSVTPKVQAIRAYGRAGFALIPLNGKAPRDSAWTKTKPGSYGEKELQNGNYGVVIPETIVVVDVDPRNFVAGENSLVRLSKKVGGLSSYTVGTGGGGLHIYFLVSVGLSVVNGLKEYPGIEFKHVGRQVVGPGSVHPDTGKIYEVTAGSVDKLSPLPAALLPMISRAKDAEKAKTEAGNVIDELIDGYVDDEQTRKRYEEWLTNSAPTSGSFIVACRGRDFGLSPTITLRLMVDVWNKRRTNPRTEAELRDRVSHAYKYAKGVKGADNPAADFSVVEAPDALTKEEKIEWEQTAQGAMRKTFLNLLSYLRVKDSGLYKIFGYNELSSRVEFVSPAPWHKGRMPRWTVVTGTDMKMLKGYLSTRYKFEASTQSIEEAVTNVAYHAKFHPVKEYLNRLLWDGTPRLDTWLSCFLGAENSTYSRAVGRKVLCAAVMRAFSPGIKFDHVLVLEGRQDLGKSTVVEILGGEWASDAPVDPHSRDTVDAMQGRWIIEIAEMEVLRKTDEDALKAFITRRTDRCRLAYGLTTIDFPRQSIFIATKNPRADGTYLKDDTGNRRWWPIACGQAQVDFKGLMRARDQLFAEAVAVCRKKPGEPLYMETLEMKEEASRIVSARHAEHEWTEHVASWIAETDKRPETRREHLTVRDIFIDAMRGEDVKLDRKGTLAIASILRSLGWAQAFRRVDGRFQRVWVRDAVDLCVSEL